MSIYTAVLSIVVARFLSKHFSFIQFVFPQSSADSPHCALKKSHVAGREVKDHAFIVGLMNQFIPTTNCRWASMLIKVLVVLLNLLPTVPLMREIMPNIKRK